MLAVQPPKLAGADQAALQVSCYHLTNNKMVKQCENSDASSYLNYLLPLLLHPSFSA